MGDYVLVPMTAPGEAGDDEAPPPAEPEGSAGPPPGRVEELRLRAAEAFNRAVKRLPILRSVVAAGERERSTGGGLLAGGVAYRLFFWIVPAALMFAAAASILDRPMRAEGAGNGLAGFAASAQRQAIEATDTARWSRVSLLGLGFSRVVRHRGGPGAKRGVCPRLGRAHPEGATAAPRRRPPPRSPCWSWRSARGSSTDSLQAVGLGAIGALISTLVVYAAAAYVIQSVFPHADAPGRRCSRAACC